MPVMISAMAKGTSVWISNTSFIGNVGSRGGALYVGQASHDSLVIEGCLFLNNEGYQGGAIYTRNMSMLRMLNNHFVNNSASLYGATLAAPPKELIWTKPLSHIYLYSGDVVPSFSVTWRDDFYNVVLPLKLTEDFLFASVSIKPRYNHTQSAHLWGISSLPMMISTVTFDALQLFGTPGMHLFVIQPAYYHDVNKFRLETNVTISLCSLPLVEKRVAFGQYAMCVLREFPLFCLVLFNVYISHLSHLPIASCKRGCSEPFGRCNGDDVCDCQNGREGLQCQLNTGLY
jgi:predicted outer membrane repeat protein